VAKNETPKVTREMPYRFVCEHCGVQTEWKQAHVTGETDEAINQTVIPEAMQASQEGNYFDFNNMVGKCDHCGHRQSWELGEAKVWMRRSPLMGLSLGAALGGFGAFAAVFLFGLLGALVIFVALALLGMIGAFIYGLVQYLIINSDMKKTSLRHAPEIVWQMPTAQVESLAPPVS